MKALCLSVIAGLLTASCSNSAATTTTAATPIASAAQTDTFTGTLQVGGTNVHLFNVAQVGTVSATLTAVGPPSTVFVGLALGVPSGTACGLAVTINTQAGSAPQLTGTATLAGQFCVQIYDVGNLAGPASYSVTVTHP
jgi:hypothetical protein